MPPALAFIGVGSNLGNREIHIRKAEERLKRSGKIKFLRSAPIYETEPVSEIPQGKYLNTVWEIETDLSARELLHVLLEIESEMGRTRLLKNEPRPIDLDLLFFGDEILIAPDLILPHPKLQERWFVLKPLWDLRADLIHPVSKKSVCELLDEVHAHHPKS